MDYKSFFQTFLERYSKSETHRDIWYHGTSSKHLKSILSNGLMVNTKEKSWESDPDSGVFTPDRTSYGGVYLTQSFTLASSSAWRSSVKFKGHPIIVILELHPRNLVADEDSISRYLSFFHDSTALFYYKVGKYGTNYEESLDAFKQGKEKWIDAFSTQMKHEHPGRCLLSCT